MSTDDRDTITSGEVRPDDWKNMEDFAAGIDTFRMPRTDALAGSSVRLEVEDGSTLALDFETGDAARSDDGGGPLPCWYEAVAVREDVHYLSLTSTAEPMRALIVVLLRGRGRALLIDSVIADAPTPGRPRVGQRFRSATIAGAEVTGEAPAETRDLIGLRAQYRYSPEHLYEHIYLSSERYCWQCLQGAQRGHGDVDLSTTYALGERLYVFTFREFIIPVAATWLYDFAAMRTTGTFFGLEEDGSVSCAPGGAYITELGRVVYPEVEPT